ncbi:MAG: hypothetical protein ACFFA5_05065 [Promethearchaeota archaeon]
MENDLTLQQLDDFLTVLLDRFQTMFNEMRALDETFESVDMSAIKRIVVYSSPEKGSVLEIFDKLIDYMFTFPILERIGEVYIKSRIQTLSDAFDIGFKYESAKWAEDRRITNSLLQRLDRFLELIRLRKPSFLKEE